MNNVDVYYPDSSFYTDLLEISNNIVLFLYHEYNHEEKGYLYHNTAYISANKKPTNYRALSIFLKHKKML